MSILNHREFKELDKLYKKSGFTKLSQQEQRRLERLEALSQDNKKGVEKEKWVNDRKSKKYSKCESGCDETCGCVHTQRCWDTNRGWL